MTIESTRLKTSMLLTCLGLGMTAAIFLMAWGLNPLIIILCGLTLTIIGRYLFDTSPERQ